MRRCTLPRLLIAVSCSCLLTGGSLHAQYTMAFGIAPEVSWTTVEHSKQVTVEGGSSTSVSDASGAQLAASVFGEISRARAGGSTEMSLELEVVVPASHLLEGKIEPTNSGQPHDVWPGLWDFEDR